MNGMIRLSKVLESVKLAENDHELSVTQIGKSKADQKIFMAYCKDAGVTIEDVYEKDYGFNLRLTRAGGFDGTSFVRNLPKNFSVNR